MKKHLLTLFFICLTFLTANAQPRVEMATGLRSSGKIYVVVIGLLVIFCGFIFYLFTLDRRIRKLEKLEKIKKEDKVDN